MSNLYANYQSNFPVKQRGVVLFIALIALVVMSLAAVALIRSVDTNTLIAGNLSSKQSAVVSSDRGLETALNWIFTTYNANPAALHADNPSSGYYATFNLAPSPNLDDPAVLKDDATWADAFSEVATGSDIVNGVEDNGNGNRIRYIVQRMCRQATPASADKCLSGGDSEDMGSKKAPDTTTAGLANINPIPAGPGGLDPGGYGAGAGDSVRPIYRITVRVNGPKNTVSYAQTFVY